MLNRLTLIFTVASFAAVVSSCKSVEHPDQATARLGVSTVSFPKLKVWRSPRDARLQGELLVQEGCLRVVADEESYLILWPSNASLDLSGSTPVVRQGSTKANAGKVIALGGYRITSLADVVARVANPESISCEGPFWLTSNILES